MTIREAIERVDEIKPNAVTERRKAEWLEMLDNKIRTEIMLLDISEKKAYKYPDCLDWELLLDDTWRSLYEYHLCSEIDIVNNEYDKAVNTQTLFNSELNDFTVWFANAYEVAQYQVR
ncbi:MAG: hypothetical protein LBT88_06600 [Oscillospiraceae bacterium]|nr:hypothetical protein [Oscillospiraceae bacterium]